MRVLFVVKNLRISNGVSSFVMNYYRELIKYPNTSFDFLIVSDVGSPYYGEIKKYGSNIYIMPSLRHPFKIIKFLKKIFNNNCYDILHSNVFNSNFPIAYYAKKNGVPVRILHSHATVNGDNWIKQIRNLPFQFLSIKLSNYYFACSNLAGKSIFKNKKYYVVNNAINLSEFEYSSKIREEIRKENNIYEKTTVIGVVGRITMQKNPYFILNIVKLLKQTDMNFKLWWFGSGDMDKEIIDEAKKLDINNNIVFWGSKDGINKYYNAMDCFILPSFYEGLPVVGIEAQASGLKCIFSDKITKEVCLTPYSSFLPIDSPKLWADKIREPLIDREKIIKTVNLSNYSIDKLSASLYKKYLNCLKEIDKI